MLRDFDAVFVTKSLLAQKLWKPLVVRHVITPRTRGGLFFPRRVGWEEGVRDTCSREGRTGFAARRWCVDDDGITFFFFLSTGHGQVPWDLGLTVVKLFFFFFCYSLFFLRFYRVRELPYEAEGGSEKRLYRCFVYLCVCTCVHVCVDLGVI